MHSCSLKLPVSKYDDDDADEIKALKAARHCRHLQTATASGLGRDINKGWVSMERFRMNLR